MNAATYRELLPAAPLRRFVECYWFLNAPSSAALEAQPILPDGCMEMVFNLGSPFRRCHPDGRMEIQPSRMLVGQMDHHVTVLPKGPIDVVGVRFRPSGAHPLFRFPMSDLRNRLVPLSDVADLPACLDEVAPEERKRALDAMLLPRFQAAVTADPGFEHAVERVVASEGRVSVDGLSRDLGVSARHLERKFRERVGLGPKRFAKVLRFGRTRTNIGMDLYNLFNANTPTTYETVYDPATNGARWMQPTAVLLPRFMRFNVQFDF